MGFVRRRLLARMLGVAAAALLVGAVPGAPVRAQDGDLVVFAAASLKNALDDVNAQWRKETGKSARISYAATSALAKQIEAGAPAQVFLSANVKWMDYLAKKSLIKGETRSSLLGNRIVLIAAKDQAGAVDIKPGLDLAKLLGTGRLAVANVKSVPAGLYAKAALDRLGIWPSVSGRLAQVENVRVALALVSRGEAPYGIVYKTDSVADPGVKVVGTFPESSHPPIIYPVALTANARHPDATAFLAYIRSARARPLFEAQGFVVLGNGRS